LSLHFGFLFLRDSRIHFSQARSGTEVGGKEAENDPELAAQLADEKEKAKNFDEFSE